MPFKSSLPRRNLFYLYSSDAKPRYKRNILDILCYPEDHVFRFRYQAKYVAPQIRQWQNGGSTIEEQLKTNGSDGLAIFAETVKGSTNGLFRFYPTRQVEIVGIKAEGTVYYVDIKLGQFVNYYWGLSDEIASQDDENRKRSIEQTRQKFEEIIKISTPYPLPEYEPEFGNKTWEIQEDVPPFLRDYTGPFTTPRSQGYFFDYHPKGVEISAMLGGQVGTSHYARQAWESTVDLLSRSEALKESTFYRVVGFTTTRSYFGLHSKTMKIAPEMEDATSIYPIPAASTVSLNLQFYKSQEAWNETKKVAVRELKLGTKSEVFAGFSKDTIEILSRYDEEQIKIATKRVFESVFAPIWIEPNTKATTADVTETCLGDWASRPFLITKVSVSKAVFIAVVVLTLLASLFLTVGPDSVKSWGESLTSFEYTASGRILIQNKDYIANLAKTFGAFTTLLAAFLAFRRFPVGPK